MSDSATPQAFANAGTAANDPAAAPAKPPRPAATYSNHAIHLMRTAQMSTLKLSQMAAQKASILLGATFLVFSLSVSRLETDRTVFETMAHDMYQNGQVLAGKEYRFLALAYKVFMIGLFVTLAVFGFEMTVG